MYRLRSDTSKLLSHGGSRSELSGSSSAVSLPSGIYVNSEYTRLLIPARVEGPFGAPRSISAACQGVPVVETLIALFSVVEIVIAYGRVLWILW